MKTINLLDERQEQVLLKIEHNGYLIAFWGLLAVLLAEAFFLDMELKAMAGEWIVFMVLSVYVSAASARNGIWDRRLKPDAKSNARIAGAAALIFGALVGVGFYLRIPERPLGCLALGAVTAVAMFGVLMLTLSLAARKVKRVTQEQEEEE